MRYQATKRFSPGQCKTKPPYDSIPSLLAQKSLTSTAMIQQSSPRLHTSANCLQIKFWKETDIVCFYCYRPINKKKMYNAIHFSPRRSGKTTLVSGVINLQCAYPCGYSKYLNRKIMCISVILYQDHECNNFAHWIYNS